MRSSRAGRSTLGSTGRYLAIALAPLVPLCPETRERPVPARGRGVGPAVPPRLARTSRPSPAHRLRTEPAAVPGGTRPRLLGSVASPAPGPFGRRLGEDARRGSAAGLAPSPAR